MFSLSSLRFPTKTGDGESQVLYGSARPDDLFLRVRSAHPQPVVGCTPAVLTPLRAQAFYVVNSFLLMLNDETGATLLNG